MRSYPHGVISTHSHWEDNNVWVDNSKVDVKYGWLHYEGGEGCLIANRHVEVQENGGGSQHARGIYVLHR